MIETSTKYLNKSIAKIYQNVNPTELYGKWNALIAFNHDGDLLGYEKAHDGDFFPESFDDYIERIRRSIKNRKTGIDDISFPVRVDIDITQKCNSNCTFCFSKKYQNKLYSNQWISKEDLDRLLKSLSKSGVKSVRYCGGGEPLLHPDIKEILKLPKKYDLLLSLITNGDYLDDELTKLIAKYVNKLHWSVNAATDQLRQKIHRPLVPVNSLSQTIDYVHSILTLRKIKKLPMVWASYLIIPESIHEIVPATKMLKRIGVDSVSFRPVNHGLHSDWSKPQLEQLQIIMNRIKEHEDSSFLVFTPKRNILESSKLKPDHFFKKCISRNLRTIIEPGLDGLFIQNCGLYRGTGNQCGLKISDVNDFSAIWNSFQSKLNPVKAPFNCDHCIDISMNTSLNFIEKVLLQDDNATFYCARIENFD